MHRWHAPRLFLRCLRLLASKSRPAPDAPVLCSLQLLDARDSGLHLRSLSPGDPGSISGGVPLTGFRTVGASVWASDASFLDNRVQPRHLFMGGERLTRTRAGADVVEALGAANADDDGYTISGAPEKLLEWSNASPEDAGAIEFVFANSNPAQWSESRCTVQNVSVLGSTLRVNMKNPCFTILRHKPCGQGWSKPSSIENVPLSSAEQPLIGTWILERTASSATVKVISPTTPVDVVMPVMETLIEATNASFVTFTDLIFEYATYSRPSGPLGFVEQQSGAILSTNQDGTCNDVLWVPMQSNLVFLGTDAITFDQCTLQHLGAGGLQFRAGAHNATVQSCTFQDISGTAIQIGDYDTMRETDPRRQELFNTVQDCTIDRVAAEFHGTCGIQIGYSAYTTIAHNTITNLPYTGITIGWGWAREPISYAGHNLITANRISHFKGFLGDGGGVYALGPQQGSIMSENWISDMGAGRGGGGYYPDEGSAFWTITRNVFSNSSFCADDCEWLHIWTSSIHDIVVSDCWTDTATQENHGTNCTESAITVVEGGKWPVEAIEVMQAAGRR